MACGFLRRRFIHGHRQPLRENQIDLAARVDFQTREYLVGQADVVVGDAIERTFEPLAQTGAETVAHGRSDRSRRIGRGVLSRQRDRLSQSRDGTGEKRTCNRLTASGHKARSDARLAVVARHITLDACVQSLAALGHAAQTLQTNPDAFARKVARGVGRHKASHDVGAKGVGKTRKVLDFEQHRHGVG